jgi:uncharacterized protein DUF3152
VFAVVVALVGGVWLTDPAALANLPWGGLKPPDSGSTNRTAGAAAGNREPPGPARPGPADARANRSVRPPAGTLNATVLSLSGDFPSSGPGSFVFAAAPGSALGTAGPLRRFQVGIEQGAVSGTGEVGGEDLAAFAAKVDETLGDPRGWTTGGQVRLQRVSPAEQSDFTIYLATPETTRKMCAQGKVDIQEMGQPYTSCRTPGKVILNLARWRLSVPDYVAGKVPLDAYRRYMINHEVGHELGHGHELCPGAGQPAPVMQQQTLGLHGCTANSWPYLNGKRYAGPPGAYDDSAG